MPPDPIAPDIQARKDAMAVLARAGRDDLTGLAATCDWPEHAVMKAPETGTVMVEGRAGGSGRRFNLGEATVTRCVVRLADGRMGFSYALGRDGARARIAAVLEALLQGADAASPLRQALAALGERQNAARDLASRKAAATKVEFFTLVRGHA